MIIRTLLLTFVAAAIAFAVDLVIGALAIRLTRVPAGFPPFTTLPILTGAVGGAVLAALVYSVIRTMSYHPDRTFFFVSITAFALSLGLPLRLSFTRSLRFAGVTPAAQMVLVLMHAVMAVVIFITLTSKTTVR